METVNVKIGSLTFDHAAYDAAGDVLYLHIGKPQPGEGEETPEGRTSSGSRLARSEWLA